MSLLSRLAVQAARAYGILSAADKTKVVADYLVVAGGGGGGANAGGGGGAGGLRSTVTATGGGGSLESAITLSTLNTYSITVGAGGSFGSTTGTPVSTNGTNSSISGTGLSTITSTGGGRGLNPDNNGVSGGSGSGAAGTGSKTGGAGTTNQGYKGGDSNATFIAGGGGGAGAVGGNASGSTSGNGGAGVAVAISGSSVTYAGGGGGGKEGASGAGTGGSGGGGNGAAANGNGTAGTANTGGGGGGGSNGATVYGGAGGSGIVIISYTSATPKFVGGTITTSGGKQIHTFTSSGTLSPITPITASYLVVAGGGGGGASSLTYDVGNGGGGAGGLLTSSTTLYSGATYVVTVGAGGGGGAAGSNVGSQGSSSSVSGTGLTTISTTGGGFGATYQTSQNGGSGGSGGGGAGGSSVTGTGGTGTTGQGFAGGNSGTTGVASYAGGGGGGSSAAGQNGSTVSNNGGNGGAGTASSINGSSVTYAGGGGGGCYTGYTAGTGGSGGGGAGGTWRSVGNPGTANLGGGGGGASGGTNAGGNGGSGIVIISYAGSQAFNGGLVTSSGGNTIHTFTSTGALTPLTNNLNNSLRFRSSASAYLSRTPTVAGNRQTWTISFWWKRGSISSEQYIVSADTSGANETWLRINAADTLQFQTFGGTNANLTTSAVFRDPSAWYHIVMAYDSTQATAGNRFKLYVNGNQQTLTGTNPTLNESQAINNTVSQQFCRRASTSGSYADNYLTDVYLIDGQALEPYYFGNNDANGVWKPILYKGTYGTNGFYLTFGNTTSTTTLGYDSSPNGNNWTCNNISLTAGITYDAMTDVPTNTSATVANYAVMNPLWKDGTTVIAQGNLDVSNGNYGGFSTLTIPTNSKFYAEFTVTATEGNQGVGILKAANAYSGVISQADMFGSNSVTYYSTNGNKFVLGGGSTAYGSSWGTIGDVIGIAVDTVNNQITFYKNNTSQGVITGLTSGIEWVFATGNQTNTGGGAWNFGQRPFQYSAPSGFLPLNTYNLP